MNNDKDMIKIDLDSMIRQLEESLSMKLNKKPIVLFNEYDKNKVAAAGSLDGENYLVLNSLHFSNVNDDIYIKNSNPNLLRIIITHELIHLLSNNNKKSGINDNNKYKFTCSYGKGEKNKETDLSFNEGLNEGITQMITEKACNYQIGPFFNAYYDYKKIAQVLEYLFGTDVIYRSYFKQSGELKKGMNNYSNHLFEKINEKLTYSFYLTSLMKHRNVDNEHVSFSELEKEICKDIKEELFMESLELIINNLIVPWIRNLDTNDVAAEICKLLSLFDDNVELKNKIMFLLMNGYKDNKHISPYLSTNADDVASHIISFNNSNYYKILDDGNIVDLSTNSIIPYDERLYEYFYSKAVSNDYYEKVQDIYINVDISDNKISCSIDNASIKQRRIAMLALKQCMKSKNIIILNDLDYLDYGSLFSISCVNEKLDMSDIMYLNNNYHRYCMKGDNSNVIKIVNKDTNREVKSNSILSLCKISYKIMLNNLDSYALQDKWNDFFNTAYDQITNTGVIKKSNKYNNNPFLALFNDGYGCEWFYSYMSAFPFKIDRINSDLFYYENEMNLSRLNSNLENEKLSLMFSNFVLENNMKRTGNIRK